MEIWLLSFESKDTVKVGGLAEVPPRLGEALVKMGYSVKILVPSHGFTQSRGDGLRLLSTIEYMGREIKIYEYSGAVVKHIIFSSKYLDEPEVYSPKYMMEKVIDWAIGVKEYAEHVLNQGIVPSVVHGNDWHSVPALLMLNNLYHVSRRDVKFYYQIHLLTRTRFTLEMFTKDLGLSMNSPLRGYYGVKTLREYYELARGYADRLGGLISDKLLTVSRNYMIDVVKRVGLDLENHVDYIPNATTWEISELLNTACKYHGEICDYLRTEKILSSDRRRVREYFLTRGIARLLENEPLYDDRSVAEYVKSLKYPPFKGEGRVEPFDSDGPLVIMTGRLARQKGIHVLVRALDSLITYVPELRIVLLLLPVWSDKKLLEDIVETAMIYRENLRVILGKTRSIYGLAHLAANAMVIPSIYEPFGLIALESMAAGTPAVASRTGGLAETILDIREYGVKGTGLHIMPGDHNDLASKLADLTLFMETQYHTPWSSKWYDLVDGIMDDNLRNLLISNPEAPELIRTSCLERARQYTWDRSAEKAVKIYGV